MSKLETEKMYTLSRVQLTNATYDIIENFCEDNQLFSTPDREDMAIFVGLCDGIKPKEPAISTVSYIMTDLELDVIDGLYEDSKLLVCYGNCPPLSEMIKKYDEKIRESEGYVDTETDFENLMIVLDYNFSDESSQNLAKMQAMLKEYCSDSLVFGGNISSVYENEEGVMMSMDGIPSTHKTTKLRESVLNEAEYNGKKVTLDKPFRSSDKNHKFYVYVKNDKGNVIKLGFGDPEMEIKRDDDERRQAFRARHGCDKNPGPKWKAKYWSCKMWESGKSVSDVLE